MIPTLYIGNLVKSRLKQLFLAPHPRKNVFSPAPPRRSAAWRMRKRGYPNAETVAVNEANIFRTHLDGAGSPVFRCAPPAQRRSCCPAYGFNFFFLSLDGDGSSSHRCTPNASSSCLSPYLCLSCIFAISLSLDGAGSPCHRRTPNTSPSRPLSMPLIIFAALSLLRRLSFSSPYAERCPLGSRKGTGSHPNEQNSAKAECLFSTLLFT